MLVASRRVPAVVRVVLAYRANLVSRVQAAPVHRARAVAAHPVSRAVAAPASPVSRVQAKAQAQAAVVDQVHRA